MGPRPHSGNSTLPESSNNEPLTTIQTQILVETPTPPGSSGAATPSPTPQEIIPVEQHVDAAIIQDDCWRDEMIPCFPSPGDIMPYDHSLPDFIRQITNQPNLSNLQSLSLRVVSTCISLHRMSAYLPNLRELDLEGSILNSLRDIGCSFKNLQILKVGRCQLESLDGTFGLSSLRELYAEKNLINDVSPCSNLPHIRHIDVSWNRIRNISYAGFLSVCSKLKSIVFTGNPATEVPDYRKHVRRILPQIESLDDVLFTNDDNADDFNKSELIENLGNESDTSAEIPDFYSISPSDSMNNFLDVEEDVNFLEKACKTKNSASQDHSESIDCENQDSLPGSSTKIDSLENAKNLSVPKNKAESVLGRLKATKFSEGKNLGITQKSTSIQKIDKDLENRSKKSNFLRKSECDQDFVTLPEIVPNSKTSQSSSKAFFMEEKKLFTTNEFPFETNNEIKERQQEQREDQKSDLAAGDTNTTSNFNPETEVKLGAIKKKISVASYPTSSSEKTNAIGALGVSSLTSGSPLRGNLTAALRNRTKSQGKREILKTILNDFVTENEDEFDLNEANHLIKSDTSDKNENFYLNDFDPKNQALPESGQIDK